MYCSNCGAEVKGKFCTKCGTKSTNSEVTEEIIDIPISNSNAETKQKKKKVWIILSLIVVAIVSLIVIINVKKVKTPEKAFNLIKNAIETGKTSKVKKLTNKKLDDNGIGSIDYVCESFRDQFLDECGNGFTVRIDNSSFMIFRQQDVQRLSNNIGLNVESAISYDVVFYASGPKGTAKDYMGMLLFKVNGSWYITDLFPGHGG